MKYRFKVSMGLVGCEREEIVDVPDNELAFADQDLLFNRDRLLQAHWSDWVSSWLDGGWEPAEEEK